MTAAPSLLRSPIQTHYPLLPEVPPGGHFFTGEGTAREQVELLMAGANNYQHLGIRRLGARRDLHLLKTKSEAEQADLLSPTSPSGQPLMVRPTGALFPKLSKSAILKVAEAAVANCESDTYITQSTYRWGEKNDPHRSRQTAAYCVSTGVLFVDLDCYKTDDSAPGSDRLANAREMLARAGLPEPIFVSSGRGLYLIWPLRQRISAQDERLVALWHETQRRIMTAFAELKPDAKVSDLTRVLRVIGSFNSKSSSRVRVLRDEARRVRLEDLFERARHLPLYQIPSKLTARSTAKSTHAATKHPGASTQPSSIITPTVPGEFTGADAYPAAFRGAIDWVTAFSNRLNTAPHGVVTHRARARWQDDYARKLADIVTLLRMRGPIQTGMRDTVLFWLLCVLYQAGGFTPAELPEISRRCAALCAQPLDLFESGALASLHQRINAEEVEKARWTPGTGRAYLPRFRTYQVSAATLAWLLEVTHEEEGALRVLVSAETLRARKNAARRKVGARAHLELRAQAVRLERAAGESVTVIAARHALSRASIYRILSTKTVGAPNPATATVNSAPGASTNALRRLTLLPCVQALRSEGMPLAKIAAYTGLSVPTLSRWLTKKRAIAARCKRPQSRLQPPALLAVHRAIFDAESRISGLSIERSYPAFFCVSPSRFPYRYSEKNRIGSKTVVGWHTLNEGAALLPCYPGTLLTPLLIPSLAFWQAHQPGAHHGVFGLMTLQAWPDAGMVIEASGARRPAVPCARTALIERGAYDTLAARGTPTTVLTCGDTPPPAIEQNVLGPNAHMEVKPFSDLHTSEADAPKPAAALPLPHASGASFISVH